MSGSEQTRHRVLGEHVDNPKQEGVRALQQAVPLLPLTEEEDMETLLIILVVLFLLGGGGWGYRRWRA